MLANQKAALLVVMATRNEESGVVLSCNLNYA